jgi:hypothetical protein
MPYSEKRLLPSKFAAEAAKLAIEAEDLVTANVVISS